MITNPYTSKKVEYVEDDILSVGSPMSEDKRQGPSYKQGLVRWFVLFNACCFLLGSYFCYDNPGPIEKTMKNSLRIDSA